MTLTYARRAEALRASEIREILKVTQRPEVISFAGGLPAPELFPVRELAEVTLEVLEGEGTSALQYSTTEGDPRLRAKVAERMNAHLGTRVEPGEVMITSGSQQGLDLTGKLFLDAGDVVLCESPTYLGAIQAFRAYSPRFVEVATDDDGMVPADLADKLRRHAPVKLLYVVPDFQNPSGRCWSLDRRQRLVEAAIRHGVPVVEDCPYGELRFEGEALPAVKALDGGGLVIFLGTFSKTFCPGLRLGWVAARSDILERYVLLKQGSDLHTSTLAQCQLNAYLERYQLDDRIATIRQVYRRRRDAMLAALDRELPPGVRVTRPRGGLFLWLELPPPLDARELLRRCLERDVAFVPGGSFFPNGGHENTLRLNFSNMPEARIAEGIRRLGRVVGEALTEPAAVAV